MTTTPPSPHAGQPNTAHVGQRSTAELVALAHHSHRVITGHQHASGAYPAAPWFSAYTGYAWLRDGSFTAEGVSRYGDASSADRFHDWTAGVLTARRERVAAVVNAIAAGEQVPEGQLLPTRYSLTGADGSAEWWNFQTDGYGTWLWAVSAHISRHGRDSSRWLTGVETCVDYLLATWHLPCYDWWEEHREHRHVSTLAAISGGLRAVARAGLLDPPRATAAEQVITEIETLVRTQGVRGGHLTKWLGTEAVDASLAACVVPFGLVPADDPIAGGTLDALAAGLDVDRGVHRYAADVFYGGGQWPLLSALLGWNRVAIGDPETGWRYLEWVAAQANQDRELPEQVDHHLLAPAHQERWRQRWGPVATPLLWSHGMYLILADALGLLAPGASA